MNNPTGSYAASLIAQIDLANSQTELAQARLRNADKYIVELTDRSKELLFQMAVKDNKFETLLDRMKAAYPTEAANIDKMVADVNHDYDTDEEWLRKKRAYTDSQPVIAEKTKSRDRERTQSL